MTFFFFLLKKCVSYNSYYNQHKETKKIELVVSISSMLHILSNVKSKIKTLRAYINVVACQILKILLKS